MNTAMTRAELETAIAALIADHVMIGYGFKDVDGRVVVDRETIRVVSPAGAAHAVLHLIETATVATEP